MDKGKRGFDFYIKNRMREESDFTDFKGIVNLTQRRDQRSNRAFSGIFLAAIGGYAVLPAVYSYLSAHIASLATSLSAAGSKVAWVVIGILERLTSNYLEFAGTYLGEVIIDTILAAMAFIIREINEGNEVISSIDLYDDEGNYIGINIISKEHRN